MTTAITTLCPKCGKHETESAELACKACQVELRQEWETPPEFYSWIDRIWSPEIDVCASESNTKCRRYLNTIINTLEWNWVEWNSGPTTFYCNPPYADVRPWIDRAAEAAQDGAVVVMLLPATLATSTNGTNLPWFGKALNKAAECHLLWPRIKFIPPKFVKASSPTGANALFVFRPSPLDLRRTALEPVDCPIHYTMWAA